MRLYPSSLRDVLDYRNYGEQMKRILSLFCCLLFTVPVYSVGQTEIRIATAVAHKNLVATAENAPSAPPCSATIPAGTHVFMRLDSPLHTTSAIKGSQVYLETVVPVIANNCKAIPERARILGTVVHAQRPGRIRGKAQMRLHFDKLILPDNREYSVEGDLQSLPGSNRNRVSGAEHTIEPVDQIDPDIHTMAASIGTGVLVGSIGHVGIGTPQGALIGAGLGLAKVLFTRGHAISLFEGTEVEMVLKQPLTVQGESSPKTSQNLPATDNKNEPLQ
jgi:hypothetical protein